MKKIIFLLIIVLVFSCSKNEKEAVETESSMETEEVKQETDVKASSPAAKKAAPEVKKAPRSFANLIKSLQAAGFNEAGDPGEPNFKIYNAPKIMAKVKADAEISQDIITATSYFSRANKSYSMIYELKSAGDANAARAAITALYLDLVPKLSSPGGMTNEDGSVVRINGTFTESGIRKCVEVNGEYLLDYGGRYTPMAKFTKVFKNY